MNLILVGDPQQLPATILSRNILGTNRGQSTMQRLMEGCNYPVLLLDTQYRMHPEISSLPNRLFYDGRLIDSSYIMNRKSMIRKVVVPQYSSSNHNDFCIVEETKKNKNTDHTFLLTTQSSYKQDVISITKKGTKKQLNGGDKLASHWLQPYTFIDVPSMTTHYSDNDIIDRVEGEYGYQPESVSYSHRSNKKLTNKRRRHEGNVSMSSLRNHLEASVVAR